jgi:hypothetical protein
VFNGGNFPRSHDHAGAWYEPRVCLFVEKLDFSFGKISKSTVIKIIYTLTVRRTMPVGFS